jgi:hypothetical protein
MIADKEQEHGGGGEKKAGDEEVSTLNHNFSLQQFKDL